MISQESLSAASAMVIRQRVHAGGLSGVPVTVATVLEQIPHGHVRRADVAGVHIGQAVAIAERPPDQCHGHPSTAAAIGALTWCVAAGDSVRMRAAA
jgi:hypothetical protein